MMDMQERARGWSLVLGGPVNQRNWNSVSCIIGSFERVKAGRRVTV